MRYFSIITLFVCVCFCSCKKTENKPTKEQLDSIAKADSAALHIAIVNNEDCLPIYYAKYSGLSDSLKLDLRLLSFGSDMDCDTAIANEHVEIAYSDVARAILNADKNKNTYIVSSFQNKQTMVAYKKNNISMLSSLKQHIVAMERFAASDYLCDVLMDSASLEQTDIYKPQINDFYTRYKMLCGNQYEVAILPEPYATIAIKRGNKMVWQMTDQSPKFGAFAVTRESLSDPHRIEQLKLFTKIYNDAVEQICTKPDTLVLNKIYQDVYKLNKKEIETAINIKPQKPVDIDIPTITMLINWLSKRGKVSASVNASQIIREDLN